MIWVLLALACSSPPAEETVPEPAHDPVPAAEPAAPAKGSIGGHPILPDPVVVGGISTPDVQAGVESQMAAIKGCHGEGVPMGKVLVKFTIDAEGKVDTTSVKSTSLRHAATESCVLEAVQKATFPKLASGRLAIVHYPFVFP